MAHEDNPFELETEQQRAEPRIGIAVKEREENKVEPMRPHVVLVWNDEEHSAEFVILVLMKVCGMKAADAIETTVKIHHEGKAPVWRGFKEHAEFKRDQIATFRDEVLIRMGAPNLPLNVTIAEE